MNACNEKFPGELLSMDLTVDQKRDIIGKEYQIATENGVAGKCMKR